MKNNLLLVCICFYLFVPLILVAQPQKGGNYATVDHANIAVFLIDYPDTKDSIRALYPSVEEIRKEIFDPTSIIQRYFKSMSYGKFQLTGEVFGPFTHQDSITADNNYQLDFYRTIQTIEIPNFQSSNFTHFVFISFNDYIYWGGLASAGGIVTINNVGYEIPLCVQMTIRIGHYMRDLSNSFENSFTEIFGSAIFVPLNLDPFGELDFPNYTAMTSCQRQFLHELIHTLGVWVHANSKTNGNRYIYEPEVANNYNFLNREYGNVFDIMGTSPYGTSLNGGFCDLLGWTDDTNRIKLDNYTQQRIRLYPINRQEYYRICEIRIPYKYSPFDGHKNKGYFLEVHEVDKWDSTLSHPFINDNTKGILLLETDGYITSLLDASPSSNLVYDWGSFPDFRDVALRPGMNYQDSIVYFTNIEEHNDGSFSVDIEILDSSAVSVKEDLITTEKYFSLGQNYPNPFNPTTTIKYSVPKTNFVQLKVYDVMGREIVVLVNEEKHPGNYEVKFDANKLSSGIYFYKIQSDNFVQTKKMMFMK